jgi:hypothetical protein
VGRINGGGPEITFKTFNGDIRIRKGSREGRQARTFG